MTAASRSASEDFNSLSQLSNAELLEQGRKFFEKREAPEALSRFLIVADRYNEDDSTEDKQMSIRALNNAGCVYKYFYYDYPQAYEYFNRALELCEAIGFDELKPVVMVNMGDILNDYATIYNSPTFASQAASLFDDCFREAWKTKDWELMTTAFYNLSNGHYDIDLSPYRDIFSEEIPSDTPDLGFVRLQFRGIEQLQKGNYAAAMQFFEKQPSSVSTHWEAKRDTITSLLNIAETFKRSGNIPRAEEALLQALDMSERSGLPDISADISRQLSDYFLASGDSASYLHYRTLFLEKREEINNSRLVNIGEMKYISDLKREEGKARAVMQRNKMYQYLTWALIIVVLTVFSSSFLIWRQNRALKSRNKSLFDKYSLLLKAESKRQEPGNESEKPARGGLDASRREDLLSRIGEIMADPDKICSPDFSLKHLADEADSNTTYVSRVINESYGISFSTLLGNARVKLVCKRINTGNMYDNLTVEAIANSVGFKSRTAFLNAFKREVGLSPSEYFRMAISRKNASST